MVNFFFVPTNFYRDFYCKLQMSSIFGKLFVLSDSFLERFLSKI